MTRRTSTDLRSRMPAQRIALLSATILATGLGGRAEAALFRVVVTSVPDPLLAGLSIPATAPTQGMWSQVHAWPINAIALGLLSNGKVVSYGTPVNAPAIQDGRTIDIWDPTQGVGGGAHVTLPGVVGVNSFCSAQAFGFDGSTRMAGGIFDNGADKGSVVLNSSATAISASPAKLANDRYYSSMLTLPTGRQLILGGSYPYAPGFSDPETAIRNRYNTGMTPELFDGTTWSSLFGAYSREAFGPDNSRFWYPRAWIAPNGKVFGISTDTMWFLDPAGNGSITTQPFRERPRNAASAADAPNVGPASTAVLYDTGKVLQVGGNSFTNGDGFLSSSRATLIDINGATPTVTETAPMTSGRAWANATVLPTGPVAVTGGSLWNDRAGSDTVLKAEIWNPASGQWSAAASAAIYRGYHSTAILMQDGTVLSAGGGAPGPVNNLNAEIFYPPYLFTGANGTAALAPRPQIVSLDSLRMVHGQTLQFELSSQNGLSQVVLVATGLVTHSFNSTQRRYAASFTQSGAAVTVQAPASINAVPPGYYQLVAIDRAGVPSPGIIVALGSGVAAPAQATAFVAPNQGGAGTGAGSNTAGGTGTGGGTGGAGGSGSVPNWPPATALWYQVGTTVTRIAVGSDGTLLGLNADDQSIWMNGADGVWVKLPGTAVDVAVVSANSIYTVDNIGDIYRYDGTRKVWAKVGHGGVTIGAAADGTVAVVNVNNDIWVKRSDGDEDAWYQVPGRAKRVAPMNRTSLYKIGMDDNVYRGDAGGTWIKVGRDAVDLAASGDGSLMVVSKTAGTLWRKIGDDTAEVWTQHTATENARAVAIPNAQRVVIVAGNKNIFRW